MNTKTMNNRIRIASMMALLVIATSGLTGCADEEVVEETPPEEQVVQNPTPVIEDGAGFFAAVKSNTTQSVPGFGDIEIPLNIASAGFFNGTDYSSFVNGGTVSCEGSELVINPNNSYTFTPTATDPSGITFQGDVEWSIGGNGPVTAFSHVVNMGFPTVSDITSSTTVTLADGYTISCNTIAGNDSTLFMVGGVVATEPAGVTSHTFSAADLSGLSAGPTVAQVAAYRQQGAAYNGEVYYFINETVETKSVTMQ